MASSKQNELLTQLITGQAVLVEKVDSMNSRLFGEPGQPGALRVLFEKHEGLAKDVIDTREKITMEIKDFNEKEVKPLGEKVIELQNATSVSLWRTGTISGVGSAGMAIGIQMLFKKILGIH